MESSFWIAVGVWLLLSLFVAWLASRFQRSPSTWFILAIAFSPLVAFVFLLMAGVFDAGQTDNIGAYREPSKEDQRESKAWELNTLRKRAGALVQRGELKQAINCLEQFIAKADNAEQVNDARRLVDSLQSKLAARDVR